MQGRFSICELKAIWLDFDEENCYDTYNQMKITEVCLYEYDQDS